MLASPSTSSLHCHATTARHSRSLQRRRELRTGGTGDMAVAVGLTGRAPGAVRGPRWSQNGWDEKRTDGMMVDLDEARKLKDLSLRMFKICQWYFTNIEEFQAAEIVQDSKMMSAKRWGCWSCEGRKKAAVATAYLIFFGPFVWENVFSRRIWGTFKENNQP